MFATELVEIHGYASIDGSGLNQRLLRQGVEAGWR
jgi:hypothetical protein